MRSPFLFIALLITFVSFGQSDSLIRQTDSLSASSVPLEYNKITFYLFDGRVLKGRIITIYDHDISYSKNTNRRSVDYTPPSFLPINKIAVVYVKRNSFLTGMGYGAVLGFAAGYGLGQLAYETEDEGNKVWKSFKLAGLTMVPFAVFGAFVGPIVTRKRFVISGSRDNLVGVCIKLSLIR
ncbi:MAG TPA: hypothetical protein VM012_04350 [Flavitalea sp.]|nr:hypothetical protein [Flavitalea sp.]